MTENIVTEKDRKDCIFKTKKLIEEMKEQAISGLFEKKDMMYYKYFEDEENLLTMGIDGESFLINEESAEVIDEIIQFMGKALKNKGTARLFWETNFSYKFNFKGFLIPISAKLHKGISKEMFAYSYNPSIYNK